jgi:hypothetical protein
LPVVQTIHGDESLDTITGGVAAINKRAETAAPIVAGIAVDLNQVFQRVGAQGVGAHQPNITIHSHVNSINCALTDPAQLLGILNVLSILTPAAPASGCDAF